MQIFGHVAVFISIILGLAVVHLLGGLSLILDRRTSTKVYWVHLLWTCNMLLAATLVWMGAFVLARLPEIGVLHFLNLMAYAVVTYLMAGLLYPVQGEEITDFREHFVENRTRFYWLGIAFVAIDALDGALEHFYAGVPWDIGQYGTLGTWLVLFLIALRLQSERFDAVMALAFAIGIVGWLISVAEVGVLAL